MGAEGEGAAWDQAGALLGASYVQGGRQQRVVGNGTISLRPGPGLPLLCQMRAAEPGRTAPWRLQEARDIPIRRSAGVAAENRVLPVPREEEKHGPTPAGPHCSC